MSEPLAHEKALELLRAAQAGDESARAVLTERNMPLVASVVRGFLGRGVEYDDLMQLGALGLVKAISGFDESFGVRFSTYAVPMIAGEIKRFLRDDGMIKVSRALKENAVRVCRAAEELKRKAGREPTLAEISAATGIEAADIAAAMDAVREPVSIYEPTFDDTSCLLDTLASDECTAVVDKLMLKQLLASLSERERLLVRLRYFEDKTQSEIAAIVGVSQVQVSRLLSKTIEKLRTQASE